MKDLASLGVIVALAAIAIVALTLAAEVGDDVVEVALLILGGSAGLIGFIAGLIILLARLDLTNKEHAFGLPAGTVRGTIALILIVLFGIVSMVLYFDVASTDDVADEVSQAVKNLEPTQEAGSADAADKKR